MALVRLTTWTGLNRSVVVPSPSWPKRLRPQAQIVPSPLTAKVAGSDASPDVDTATTSSRICTGLPRFSVVPSPRTPFCPLPHAQSVPSALRPNVHWAPATREVNGSSAATRTGPGPPIPGSPYWPLPLLPHTHTLPSVLRM